MKNKIWTTENGEEIPYSKLENRHLLNILSFIEKKSKKGITLIHGGGHYIEDMWYEEEIIKGDEVKKHFDYEGLKKEAGKRKLLK